MKKFIGKFWCNETGATAIEYGLIAALIAVAAITAMGTVGKTLSESEEETVSKVSVSAEE